MIFKNVFKSGARKSRQLAVTDRPHRGRARVAGEKRQFTNTFTAGDFANRLFRAVAVLDRDAQPTRQHDVHRIADIAGAKQSLAAGERAPIQLRQKSH